MKNTTSFIQRLDIYQLMTVPLVLLLLFSLIDFKPMTVRVGIILPISAENSLSTMQMKYGAELAVKHINQSGGINGYKFVPIIAYSEGSALRTAEICRKMIYEQNVMTIIGSVDNQNTKIIKYFCEKASIPFITNTCTSKGIISNGRKFTFRSISDDSKQIDAIVGCLAKRFNCQNVALIYDSNEYEPDILAILDEMTLKHGLKVASCVSCANEKVNFRKQLDIIKTLHVGGIIVLAAPKKSALILRQIREMGMKMPVIGGNGMSDKLFIRFAGIYAESSMGTLPFNARRGKQRAEYFLSEFSDTYSMQADSHAALEYEAVILTSLALKAGYPDKIAVRDAFASMHGWESITGSGGFNENGNQVRPAELAVVREGQAIPVAMEGLF